MRILITGGNSDITKALIHERSNDTIYTTHTSTSTNTKSILFNLSEATKYTEYLPDNIDVLILNAASYVPPRRRLHEFKIEKIVSEINMNILGNITLLHHYLPKMIEKNFGRIIFISSVSTQTGTSKYPLYIAAKSALEGLIKNIVVDYSKNGITANTLQLGAFKTSRTKPHWEKDGYESKINKIIPSGRMGIPNDILPIIDCIIKSSYLNGAQILVSGGLPLMSAESNI